ncbi:LysR family transcriptional regulator [Raoultella terrigena]|jgi:DNA-binding transcriptional LysR family regulator|uniref:LysR family transcriptional regulator n=1 Tax=Raoultella terrigena TaxID=577 RepID=A0A485CGA7_RAOTE|nr:LysR family transcriptional regulator [Raoultella terrigena]MEB8195012.1 LysR family transcriptional regulator [Raoultella terrigena]NWK88599.1 LysR family transcriptional regulator [Raoultella terrigena]QIT27235.1 LysR family transcriptional regulator [Raoultella terrigena]VED46878.1 LysR family transcriptional regulator [Raoultella terrigena]VFS83653.1 Symbiotic regulator homolog 1 [Raoultella terrigena]
MDFHGIDLNLLAAFDALMSECNVTRAATRVGVSQPAMSAALSRLRKLLGDPLFLRSAEGLLPTPRARELAEPISQALRQLEATLVRKPDFVPGVAKLTVNLGLSDYPAFVVLPALLEALAEQAPGISVNVHAFNDRDHAVDLLDAGAIDVAIGVPPTHSDGRILTRPILRDEFVTIIASKHPAARRGMNMKTYLSLPHALASPEGQRHGLVDQALAQLGQQRTLALTLPHMFALPAIVARTGMTATVMKRVALQSPAGRQLAFFPPPVTLPEIVFYLIWHRRSDGHQAQKWLRTLIESIALAL